MRVEKPSNKVLPTQSQLDATDETNPDVGVGHLRPRTERGWEASTEHTIVGPPPPADSPRGRAGRSPRLGSRPKLAALPALDPVSGELVPAEAGLDTRDTVPEVPALLDDQVASQMVPAAARKPQALVVDDSGPAVSPAARIVPQSVALAAARANGFPRSAAARAGAPAAAVRVPAPPTQRRSAQRRALSAAGSLGGPAGGVLASTPPGGTGGGPAVAAPRLAQATPLRSSRAIARPGLAQGSVTAPLPSSVVPAEAAAPARRRPPTVEFPTLDASDLAQPADPGTDQTLVDVRRVPDPAPPARPLPSLYSVVDRRHAPRPPAESMAGMVAARPAPMMPAPMMPAPMMPAPMTMDRRSELEAVPEPIPPEIAPVPRPEPRVMAEPRVVVEPRVIVDMAPRRAPAPAPRARPATHRPAARPVASHRPAAVAQPRPRIAPAAAPFSASESAFFAAGEELERADSHPLFDDLDDAMPPRPTLWRRLTGRHRRLS
ncbi:MAG TPA: hypothetical protein VKB80_21505 [Kofleriaceae bacterium]|nr:hypothetical protein [Kofleriaceae bacterium]